MTFLPLGYPDRSKQPRVYPGKIMQMYILLRYVIPVMFLFFNFFQKKEMQSLQPKKQRDRISLLYPGNGSKKKSRLLFRTHNHKHRIGIDRYKRKSLLQHLQR